MRAERINALVFYAGIPAVVGYMCGSFRAGVGQDMPWGVSVFFWISLVCACWLLYHVATVAAAKILRPWSPTLPVKLAAGILLASLPARVLTYEYIALFEGALLPGSTVPQMPPLELSTEFFVTYAKNWFGVYILWIGANLFFDRHVGMSRYRDKSHVPTQGPSDRPAPQPGISQFLSRLPPALGLNVKCLRSEDHYVRVYTDLGDALVLYRLSDAISELTALGYDGIQVHRSYWINRDAVTALEVSGRRWTLRLDIELAIPVSQTYRQAVKDAGFPRSQT